MLYEYKQRTLITVMSALMIFFSMMFLILIIISDDPNELFALWSLMIITLIVGIIFGWIAIKRHMEYKRIMNNNKEYWDEIFNKERK